MESKSIISGLLSILIHLCILILLGVLSICKGGGIDSNLQKNAIQIEFTSLSKNIEPKKDEIKKPIKKQELKKKKIEKKETIKKIDSKKEVKKVIKETKKKEKEKKQESEELKEVEKTKNEKLVEKENKQKENKKTIDNRAIYTNQQSNNSSGAMLELKGWTWDNIPRPNDLSDEVGKIVFIIKIDQFGEIIQIKTLERTVSLKVEAIYREALEMISFSRTSTINNKGISTGKVTFFIRYK